MAEYSEILTRIDRLAARAAVAGEDSALVAELEDVLAQGYTHALTEEARSRRLETRLGHLVDVLDEPGAAVEARRLATQRRAVEKQIGTLRGRLAMVREQFVRLGGGHSAPS